MKARGIISNWATGLAFTLLSLSAAIPANVRIEPQGPKLRLSWPATMQVPDAGTVWPEYRLSKSIDMARWTQISGNLRGFNPSSFEISVMVDEGEKAAFFRVVADVSANGIGALGDGGAELFGYRRQFNEEIQRIGLMSLEEFASNTPQPAYLSQITFDPTSAQFWTNFYSNTAFRLNAGELGKFETNGFVVSERLGAASFGGVYYSVFHGDLPVFVTADSILQAWHRTYVNMLEEMEEVELATLVELVINNMAQPLPSTWETYGQGPLREAILDADLLLTVARSLWAGQTNAPSIPENGQQQRVNEVLSAIETLSLVQLPLFGPDSRRWMDFSQFAVRGHYVNSERLKRYFRVMMWLGRTDLCLATFDPNREDDIRQLGAAIVLHHLLVSSGQFSNWSAIEQITRAFVGVTDSMTLDQMGSLLREANILTLDDVPNLVTLTNLQTRLLGGELGAQSIPSHILFSPLSSQELKLPRSLTVFGQKFVLDSWAFSQVVFDKVHWPSAEFPVECGVTNICGKVVRRKPSCLDIAFSIFDNNQVAPEIIERIRSTNGMPFRDGLPYQHNLLAVRNVVSAQAPAAWTDNIYNSWLGALRSLSEPTTGTEYPEAMRTRAWAMKNVNAQLASWTELRHDTVLYAKQSYTPPVFCSYPYGFVEPRPEFWRKMRAMADVAAAAIAALPVPVSVVTIPGRTRQDPYFPFPQPGQPITCFVDLVKQRQVSAFQRFSGTMRTLESIAQKELMQQPLSGGEEAFLTSIMEYLGICHQGELGYTGWYPALFYENVFWTSMDISSVHDNNGFHGHQGCAMYDALVTDVHTDSPDPVSCDPGAVLHQGVGKANLLMIAVDNGPDRMIYAGPVFSHYEFEAPFGTRLTDQQWQDRLNGGKPPAPEWTRSYLVP